MKVGKDGVIISDIVSTQVSAIDPNYTVMWDKDGIPIHICNDVLKTLCKGICGEASGQILPPIPAEDSVSIENLFFT